MGLTYYLKGDYLFPNLTIESSENPIGKYGMLRRTFLKENRSNWYQSMMLTGKLDRHLLEIEKTAQERMEILMEKLLQKYPALDKEADPLAVDGAYEYADGDGRRMRDEESGVQIMKSSFKIS